MGTNATNPADYVPNPDAAGTILTATHAELNIMDGVTATAAEINDAADVSTRIVTIADATNTLTAGSAHANKICYVLDATLAVTLPEATGTGNKYTFIQGIAATSSTWVTADTTNADLTGTILGSDTDSAAPYAWTAGATDDTVTFNGVATGGKLGDWISFTDLVTDLWFVEGAISQSGASEATPFSAAV